MTDPEIVARYLAGEHVKRLHDGVTNEPVYRALRKAGIAPNRTRARWPRIAELHAQGMHLCGIAREVGATPSVVSYALKAMGLSSTTKRAVAAAAAPGSAGTAAGAAGNAAAGGSDRSAAAGSLPTSRHPRPADLPRRSRQGREGQSGDACEPPLQSTQAHPTANAAQWEMSH